MILFQSGISSLFSSDADSAYVLQYGQSVLYTWDDPRLEHELTCGLVEVNDSFTKIKVDSVSFYFTYDQNNILLSGKA